MTKKDRMRAFELRLEGRSWDEISEITGYAASTIRQDLKTCVLVTPRQVNCIYPVLRRIIVEEYGGSVRAFAQACGVAPAALYYVLPGRSGPCDGIAEAVARCTGLSREAAFCREEAL